MKNRKKVKLNIKSESGFTMQDLMAAMALFTIFVGLITTLMYTSAKMSAEARMSARAVNYCIQILEDIDKKAYDEVNANLATSYPSEFSIPSSYEVNLEVSNYNEGNSREDLIKIVKVTVSYTLKGNTESVSIEKLKVKEV